MILWCNVIKDSESDPNHYCFHFLNADLFSLVYESHISRSKVAECSCPGKKYTTLIILIGKHHISLLQIMMQFFSEHIFNSNMYNTKRYKKIYKHFQGTKNNNLFTFIGLNPAAVEINNNKTHPFLVHKILTFISRNLVKQTKFFLGCT